MFNRKQRRDFLKFKNRERLEVTDGAFGNSKTPKMSLGDLPKISKAENEKRTKELPTTDADRIEKQLGEFKIKLPVINMTTALRAIKAIGRAITLAEIEKEKQEKETKSAEAETSKIEEK